MEAETTTDHVAEQTKLEPSVPAPEAKVDPSVAPSGVSMGSTSGGGGSSGTLGETQSKFSPRTESLMSHVLNELAEEKRGKELTLLNAQKTMEAQKRTLTTLMRRLENGVQR